MLLDKKKEQKNKKMLEMHKKPIDNLNCLCYNKDEQRRTQVGMPTSIWLHRFWSSEESEEMSDERQ